MAQLNDYITDNGTNVGVPNRPLTPYDPNGIARVTTKLERHDVYAAWVTWVANFKSSGFTVPFDYAGLTYADE